MPLNERDLRNRRRAQIGGVVEPVREVKGGHLVEVESSIEDSTGIFNWIKKLHSEHAAAFGPQYRPRIWLKRNLAMMYGIEPREPWAWQVMDIDSGRYIQQGDVYKDLAGSQVGPHQEEHQMRPGRLRSDALPIFPRAITEFSVRPTAPASMRVTISSGYYPGHDTWSRFTGPVKSQDFTSSIPGTSGQALISAICIDKDGTLQYVDGTAYTESLGYVPAASLPSIPVEYMPISAVKLYNGMTTITETEFEHEIRPLMAGGGSISGYWEGVADGSIEWVTETFSLDTTAIDATDITATFGPTSTSTANATGLKVLATSSSIVTPSATHTLIGLNVNTDDALGANANQRVIQGQVRISGSGITCDTGMTFNAQAPSIGSNVLTNWYGFKVEPTTAATNNWGIYSEGSGMLNVLEGDTVVGDTEFVANRVFEVVQDGANSHVSLASFGSSATRRGIFDFLKARGSLASPSSASSGDDSGQVRFRGYDSALGGGGYATVADIRVQLDGATSGNNTAPGRILFSTGAGGSATVEAMRIDSNQYVGIGVTTMFSKLHVEQDDTEGAVPVLRLDQDDTSEEFIRFVGSATASNLTESIVDNGDVTTATLQGWVKVYVVDDGNQITDQAYYQPLYTLA